MKDALHLIRLVGPYFVRGIMFVTVFGGIPAYRWNGLLGLTGLVAKGASVHEVRLWGALLMWVGFECILYRTRHPKPQRMEIPLDKEAGYYRLCLGEYDICFATRWEKDSIPAPHRELYQPPVGTLVIVGKIHCIVEDDFWAWKELRRHPRVPDSPSCDPLDGAYA